MPSFPKHSTTHPSSAQWAIRASVWIRSGVTACQAAKTRPPQIILACTSDELAYRRLALVRGLRPLLIPQVERLTLLFEAMHEAAKATGLFTPGDTVVVTAGFPVGRSGVTNLIKVETIP